MTEEQGIQDEPIRRHGDVDSVLGERAAEKRYRPIQHGRPGGGAAPDEKGRVPGDIAHELERAGLGAPIVELVDDAAVELKIAGDELGDWIHVTELCVGLPST